VVVLFSLLNALDVMKPAIWLLLLLHANVCDGGDVADDFVILLLLLMIFLTLHNNV